MSALTNLFTALANKIRSKTGGSDTYTPPQMVNAIDDVYQAGVDAGTTPTQTKTVTAGTTATTVTPDTGYALSSVTVNPTPSQSKSATPTTTAQTITPDSGKLLSSVSVGAIQTETKSDTPNVSTNKTVSPSSGKYLSQVTIQPLTHSGTYTPAANTAQNDMGAYHDKRYVNTSGMIVPSGAKSITANGTGIDVSSYATANVNVPNPTLSGNATAADVANGKTFYSSNYTKQTGSYVEPTIASKTPSNTNPPVLYTGNNYSFTSQGYAVASQPSDVTPSSTPGYMSGNNIYRLTANGYVVDDFASISPSASGTSFNAGMTWMNRSGYAISSYDNVTPTADGTYFASGMNKMASSGYAYSSNPNIVKSDPIVMTANWKTASGNNNNGFSGPIYSRSDFNDYFSVDSTVYTAKKAFTAIFYVLQRAASNSNNGCYFKLYKNGTAILESSTSSTIGKAEYIEVQVASGDSFYMLQHSTGTTETVTTMIFEKP